MTTTGTAFAAGSVIEVRDEEWIVSSCEPAGDGWKVRCVGSSELVRATPATFYSTLDEIEALDPAEADLAQDDSPHFRRSRLWVEAVLRKTPVLLHEPGLTVSQHMLLDPLDFQRLDAWAALWFWPVTTASVAPPTREQWITALESLLGTVSRAEARKGRGLFADDASWAELDDAEQNEVAFARMRPVAQVLVEHPWLAACVQIAEQEGFFHWELDFAPVFARGGFDLQLGNPPWVRPDWDDALVLAEDDAWFGLTDKPTVSTVVHRRSQVLDVGDGRYLNERVSAAGVSAHLGSYVDRPLLAGTQPDLYRCFMDRTWRSMAGKGAVGLVHPDSHLSEARANELRRQSYRRLRCHWQFRNELKLFETDHKEDFGVSVYGAPRPPSFVNASFLFHPSTLERSLDHDGSGPEPGIKDDAGRWDMRPHASRLIKVDLQVLASWAALVDEPGASPAEARILLPVTDPARRFLTGSRMPIDSVI